MFDYDCNCYLVTSSVANKTIEVMVLVILYKKNIYEYQNKNINKLGMDKLVKMYFIIHE